ncbi:MAG: glycosyltransferase, partial [Bacillota bacterium]
MKKISVVIPVYNSEETIAEVVERLEVEFENLKDKFNFEIILVNDGSTDNVLAISKQIAKKRKYIKVINFAKNFGQPSAILAGFKYAIGDYVIALDDDLQTPP